MGVQSKEVGVSREAQAKNLIMRAWRERWTEVQWGIHVRTLIECPSTDGSFIANCMLQQALGGPGPNSLVLSYLMHSIYSQLISSSAILRSICKFDGFHKPYCVTSLLDLVDNIKDRVILNDDEDVEECVELALSLGAITHWLLTCMYSSLEKISDLSMSEVPIEVEDAKIVRKCKTLIEFFLMDSFTACLINCAVLEDPEMFQNIKKMSGEIAKFSDGHHHQDIMFTTGLVQQIGENRLPKTSSSISALNLNVDGKVTMIGNPLIQTALMSAALFRSADDVTLISAELKIIKDLKGVSNAEFYGSVIHSSVVFLVDSIDKSTELQALGFVFMVLPSVLKSLSELQSGTEEDLRKGIDLFLDNDSVLDIADTKLDCYTLEHLLTNFQRIGLLSEKNKSELLQKKPQRTLKTQRSSTNAVFLLKTDETLDHILLSLDGVTDFTKNQENLLTALYDILGNFDCLLTVAACRKKLKQLSSKLLSLNQASRQVNGEAGKASGVRAMIFDVTFLMLCNIFEHYGSEAIPSEATEYFFADWFNECMVEQDSIKNPDIIIGRCDQNKVDMLTNQCLQGDSDLKTSLVFWHDVCTNSVGVVHDMLLAWQADSSNFADVKKMLEVFRSKVCCLPVCISAYLCSVIRVSPEEESGKAKYILNQFLTPPSSASMDEDHFQERFDLMSKLITKMVNNVQPGSVTVSPTSPQNCAVESKPISELYKQCFASMHSKGRIDIDTMLSLKSLMDISGSHYFVQGLISEMLENQSCSDLLRWCGMLYGVFSLNMYDCTAALIRVVIPSMLHYYNRESNLVEPQNLALVALTVDCILSCYYHAMNSESSKQTSNNEPLAKRRKIEDSDSQTLEMTNLKFMVEDILDEFEKVLKFSADARPQTYFILRFLEQLSLKLPSSNTLLSSVSSTTINSLMSLMSDSIEPELLQSWHNLTDKSGRTNCILSIFSLKHLRNVNQHCCGLVV